MKFQGAKKLTIPSSWTPVIGISASISTSFAIEAGIASYFGWGEACASDGDGRDAARAAAIDGAAIFGKAESVAQA